MSNITVTEVDESLIKPEMFEDVASFNRFIKALKKMKKLQWVKERGGYIYVNGLAETDDLIFSIEDGNLFPRLGTGTEGCMVMWLGSTYGLKEDTVYIEVEEMDIFNNITFVEAKNIKKF